MTSMAAATAAAVNMLIFFSFRSCFAVTSPSPYLSATTLFQDYQSMLTTFKIFVYDTPDAPPISFSEPAAALFHDSLLRSRFITLDPAQAHLFFVPFSSDASPRSVSRVVRYLRNSHPYWNRTLGADHFFISPTGIDYSPDRNVLELKKNGVQIAVFPVTSGYFVPHKDVTLPPVNPSPLSLSHARKEESQTLAKPFLGYLKWNGKTEPDLVKEMKRVDEFLVDDFEVVDYIQNFKTSKFCLFLYNGDVTPMAEAMAVGCVPVLIVERPIQDLPFMDVLRWSDMVLLVAAAQGGERMKKVLNAISEEKYAEMRQLCVAASKHLMWEEETEEFNMFHMLMYQLWLRRHVVRYARRDLVV